MVSLSIVIAVYNDRDGLEAMLASLECCQFKDLQVEVIVVDDGSSVSYEDVVMKSSLEVKLFCRENGRQGAARNFGLRKSNGEYVWFLDADDVVLEEGVSSIVAFLNANIECNLLAVDAVSNGQTLKGKRESDWLDDIAENHVIVAPWNKIYRREFLLNNDLWFPEKLKYEDLLFTYLSIMLAGDSAHYIPVKLYDYKVNPGSTTNTQDQSILDIFEVLDLLILRLGVRKSIASLVYVHGIKYSLIRAVQSRNFSLLLYLMRSNSFSRYLRMLSDGDFGGLSLSRYSLVRCLLFFSCCLRS